MSQAAVVNYAPEPYSVELRDVPISSPGEEEVLIEVAAVGVCGSDLHQWAAVHSWPVRYPVILGHEFCGTVCELGARVETWSVGDRVVSETAAVIDPENPLSRAGTYNLDPSRRGFGNGVDGAMRRYVPVPARCLHRVPEGVAFEHAALTEPCCVAYNAVAGNVEVRPGDRVVVLGPGPIGLLCAVIAQLRGAEVAIVGLQRDGRRLEAAEHYGVQPIIGDAGEWAHARDGLGADGVVDAAGVSQTLKAALDLVRPAGWISKVGWGREPLDFSIDPLVQKNVRLQGSFSHNWAIWERVLALLGSGRLDVGPIAAEPFGGVWPLDCWEQAFGRMHGGEIVKAVLRPI